MTVLHELSSAIGTQIQKQYTPSTDKKMFTLFSVSVNPRTTCSTSKKITVLWSSTSKEYIKPNHFVLCKLSAPEVPVKRSKKPNLKRKSQLKISFESLKKKTKDQNNTRTVSAYNNQPATSNVPIAFNQSAIRTSISVQSATSCLYFISCPHFISSSYFIRVESVIQMMLV